MSRTIRVAAAQLGPIHKADTRESVVERLIALLREAHSAGCKLVVYPELALTTFFPRYIYETQDEIDAWFERQMPNPATQPLFDEASRLGVGFHLGYAELTEEDSRVRHYNTAILVDPDGRMVGKYRKVHLPGHAEPRSNAPFQHLEKRYFDVGNLGFPVWRAFGGVMGMCICNDRRWPETYRVMGLRGVELIMLGYNTPTTNIDGFAEPLHLKQFHNHLVMQAGAYQNACWVVAAAKAGSEDGHVLIGGSCIVAPTGEIVAKAHTEDDEVVSYSCDLALGDYLKESVFNFEKHRQIKAYELITERAGAIPPK
ncbi:MAG: N-carbamoyl-D-amino-acid hydrolase [Gammaproteobacteria bacterium]|nr:N-carbamoyl-D-amino-acid hydrolase [Gammaproteobacteria bacterium]